mmetsp:Transcript_12724/g.20022  ORF Transcript_12724/g.20022 Transcript_12724/m.20022 type:complete len:95 (+) Transcript_12724:189-473(+)
MSGECEGDSCKIAAPASKGPGGEQTDRVVVYSRNLCGLCWICRFHFTIAGLDYDLKDIDGEAEREVELPLFPAPVDPLALLTATFQHPPSCVAL